MIIDIDINSLPDKLALLYSGGADSTLLYYLIYTAIAKTNQKKYLDLILVDRHNKPIDKATRLYLKMKSELGDSITNLKLIHLPDSVPNNLRIIEVAKIIDHSYDAIIWGVNQYPDDESIRPRPEYTVNFEKFKSHSKLKLPLADYKKSDVIETFMSLGLKTILEQTHSCGQPAGSPCAQCFNCRERIWAYKKLGLEPHLGV